MIDDSANVSAPRDPGIADLIAVLVRPAYMAAVNPIGSKRQRKRVFGRDTTSGHA